MDTHRISVKRREVENRIIYEEDEKRVATRSRSSAEYAHHYATSSSVSPLPRHTLLLLVAELEIVVSLLALLSSE